MLNFADLFIDTVQNGKKQFIEKHITNPVLKTAWEEYVDTQCTFVHVAVKTFVTTTTVLSKELLDTKVEKFFNPLSIDWVRAGLDAWITQNNNKVRF